MINHQDPAKPDQPHHRPPPRGDKAEQTHRIDEAYGKLLFASGAIRLEQLQECQKLQQALSRNHPGIRLGQILIKKGYVSRSTIEDVLSKYSQLDAGSPAEPTGPTGPTQAEAPTSIPLDDPPSVDEFTGLGQDADAETLITELPEWVRTTGQPPKSTLLPEPLDKTGVPITSNPSWSEPDPGSRDKIETSGASIDVDDLLAEDGDGNGSALDNGLPGSGFESFPLPADLAGLPADPSDTVPIGKDGTAIPWGSSITPAQASDRGTIPTSGLGEKPGAVDPFAHTSPAMQTPASNTRGSAAWSNISSDTDALAHTPSDGSFSSDRTRSRAPLPWKLVALAAMVVITVTAIVIWRLNIYTTISSSIAKGDEAYLQEDWTTALEAYDIVISYGAETPELLNHRDTCLKEIARLQELNDWLSEEARSAREITEAIAKAGATSDTEQREQILKIAIRAHGQSGELHLARGRARRHANHLALESRSTKQANKLRRAAQSDLSLSESHLERKLQEVNSEIAELGTPAPTEEIPNEFPLNPEEVKPEIMMASLAQRAKLKLAECRIELALHLEFDTGRSSKAQEALKEAKLHATKAWMKHFIQGWQAFSRRDFTRATEALRRAQKAGSELAEISVLQAQARLALGDLENAERAALKASESAPLLGRAQSILAVISLERDQVTDRTYQLAARGALLGPEDPLCLVINGRALEHKGSPDGALRAYDEALRIARSNTEALLRRGLLRVQQGELQLALADLDSAIRLRPENAEAHYARGKAKHSMKNYPEARSDYQKAVSLDPSHSKAWGNLASVLMRDKDYTGAHDALERALALEPNNWDLLFNFSRMLWLSGDYDNALPLISRALAKSPSNWVKRPHAFIIRADSLAHQSPPKTEEALSDFRAAIDLTPNQLEIYKRRAFLWRRIKNEQREIDDLRTWQRLAGPQRFPAAEVNRISELEALIESGNDEQPPSKRRLFPPRRGG